MKFKAAILVKSQSPLILEDIEINPLEVGQILVKLDSSGVCGAQINEIDAVKGKDNFLPHLLGHEGHGEVVECGHGVSKVKEGDKVVLHWRKSHGINSSTPNLFETILFFYLKMKHIMFYVLLEKDWEKKLLL